MKRAAAAFVAVASLAAAREAEAQCQGRPTDASGYAGYAYGGAQVETYDTQDIRVHYTRTGNHAVATASTRGDGVPDTVAFAGDTAQDALEKFMAMGFKRPIPDSCPSNGGDERIDFYLVRFAGADGSTATESCANGKCAAFLLVESTFVGRGYPTIEEGFRTVVVHELFHAIQNAYSSERAVFWAEGSAQWAMKTLHPELVDFERQLPAFFKEPKRSLDVAPSGATAGFLYGSAVWPLFLSIRYGETIVREVLEEEERGTPTIEATDAVLTAKGSSLKEAMPLFRAWNVATGALASPAGYPDAARYPGIDAIEELADGAGAITSGTGSFAYRGTLASPTRISLETDETRNAGVLVPIEDGIPNLDKAAALPADGQGDVLVVVSGISSKKTDAPFTIRFGAPAGPPGGGGGDDGGCSTSGAHGGGGLQAFGILALAALFSKRWRRRAR